MNSNQKPTKQSPEQTVRDWFGGQQTASNAVSNDGFAQVIGSFIQTIRENRWLIIIFMLLGAIGGTLKAISDLSK